jgi:hypothetical protein
MQNDFTLCLYKKPAWEEQPQRQNLS